MPAEHRQTLSRLLICLRSWKRDGKASDAPRGHTVSSLLRWQIRKRGPDRSAKDRRSSCSRRGPFRYPKVLSAAECFRLHLHPAAVYLLSAKQRSCPSPCEKIVQAKRKQRTNRRDR